MAPHANDDHLSSEATVIEANRKLRACHAAVKKSASTTIEEFGMNVPEEVSLGATKTESPTAQVYRVLEEPSRIGRRLKVATIGAGASALNFAHDVSTSSLDIELVCYEKNPEIGGTWFENRYPGCACDIPSVNYQLSWAPKAWSK